MAPPAQPGFWSKLFGSAAPDPPGPTYGYDDVPAFIKSGVDMNKVQHVASAPSGDTNVIARVYSNEPYKIEVVKPDKYSPKVLNHELTHTFQDTRNSELPQTAVPPTEMDASTGRLNYNYGGPERLRQALRLGRTVSDFTAEQQAEMVSDYKREHDFYLRQAAKGIASRSDMQRMYAIQQAYHPFIQQLANMPGTKENLARHPLMELLGLEKPAAIDTKPQAPGLPAYDTPGLDMLPADPLMGGQSQPTSMSRWIEKMPMRPAQMASQPPKTIP